LGSLKPPLLGAPVLGAPLLGAPLLGALNPGLPLAADPGAPLVPVLPGGPAFGVLVPEPFLAAALTAIGAMTGPGAPAVEDGGAAGGAPNPEDGAVVVDVESPGQELPPELPPVEHGCGGAVVVVVVEPLPFFGLGHFGPVVDVVDPFLPEPDFPFFLAAVVIAGPDGDAEAAARWISRRGTAALPATAGATKASAVTTTVAAATPSRPMRMRDIGTSLFHSGDGSPGPACPGHRRRRARHRAVRNFSAEKGLPAQEGTKYLKPM
jgi:hypothetical protein